MRREDIEELVRHAGGTITAKQLTRAGARWEDLYEYRDKGVLTELSRGVYRLSDAPPTAHLDLVAVCHRAPDGTICLNSAASYWDLTDEMPNRVHVAVQRGRPRPRISYPPTKVHVFAAETFELGRKREVVDSGEPIAIYSPERTAVDMMRLRRMVGRDQALAAVRRYLERPGANPGRVLAIARELRAGTAVADALETLLA
jgi:predicted transcriptional regulator of viral defense system